MEGQTKNEELSDRLSRSDMRQRNEKQLRTNYISLLSPKMPMTRTTTKCRSTRKLCCENCARTKKVRDAEEAIITLGSFGKDGTCEEDTRQKAAKTIVRLDGTGAVLVAFK
jgi:hypothetical protein